MCCDVTESPCLLPIFVEVIVVTFQMGDNVVVGNDFFWLPMSFGHKEVNAVIIILISDFLADGGTMTLPIFFRKFEEGTSH